MTTAALDDPTIAIRPSVKLIKFIKSLTLINAPENITHFDSNIEDVPEVKSLHDNKLLLNNEDKQLLKSLNLIEADKYTKDEPTSIDLNRNLLNLEDLHWLYKQIQEVNNASEEKIYFHELFDGSEIMLPQNKEIARNPELEKRCQILRSRQENKLYNAMTKNVDSVRYNRPDDTIAYQLKEMNKQLIAIAQFIFSVLTGFAFGFLGIELMTGPLDFGFRLLLAIMCALIVAIAELYFLAKKLNEDIDAIPLPTERSLDNTTSKIKTD